MKNQKPKIITLMKAALLVIISVMLGSCATPTAESTAEPAAPTTAPEPTVPPEPVLEGDPVRGGLMYDKWWVVIEADSPSGDQPLWATQSTNARSGTDTWRCKECHGWDYKGADGAYGDGSHFTGFVGVIQMAGGDPNEALSALKGATNADHDFSAVMAEQDLIDIALFITQDVIDNDTIINADNSSKGDMASGETLYGEVCTLCHGPQGNAINFSGIDDPEFLGHLAPDNPWEFVHKVRFGQPGWPMPSSISNGWSNEDVANVLAYAQTFTTDFAVSGGGQLYDKSWSVVGADAPEGDQPLWATQSTNERSGADTWRCKECHGWDYMGADGAYGSGSHFTGFPGILSSASMSSDDLVSWLTGGENPDHDFSGGMEDFAINALVTFIQNEMTAITDYVNADGEVSGDPANGKMLYEGTCASCHGVDGKKINFHDADDPEYIGTLGNDNPWEFFHKASFGQPGEPMPSGVAMGWTMQEIADVIAYAKTLPEQ
jgi:thiosulfate dehydrogenase